MCVGLVVTDATLSQIFHDLLMTGNPRTMASKRKIEEIQSSEDFQRLFASAIATYETAELAVLWLMREYRFDLSILQQTLISSHNHPSSPPP
jgi:hypothetical protein